MKKETLLLLLLLIVSLNNFAEDKEKRDLSKIGIGLGYHNSSISGDSIRPFEVSLRYRLDKHTFQIYAPLYYSKDYQNNGEKPDYMKQEHYDKFSHSWTKSLWGAGIGYDYTFYSYSVLDFFAGVGIDYQAFESREDFYNINYEFIDNGVAGRAPVYEDFYQVEILYYHWNRVRAVSFIPKIGFRFTTPKISIETALMLFCSHLYKKEYYYGKWKALSWEQTWQSFYPDNNRNGYSIRPDISIHLSYYF